MRSEMAPFTFIVSAQVAVAALDAEGIGFNLNQQATGVQPGMVALATVVWGTGRWFVWTSARALVWPARPRVRATIVDGAASQSVEKSLGSLEGDIALGIGVRIP
jgi:hypothetical protein